MADHQPAYNEHVSNPATGASSDTDSDPASATTPKTPVVDQQRLQDALTRLQTDFQLTQKQVAALPTLNEISLVPQHDSHLIWTTAGNRAAHPFKLFVGEMEWRMERKAGRDPAFVYLFGGRSNQMKMEICSPDAHGHWAPIEPIYYGSVSHLAYPFIEWVGAPRFVAAVKFYFLLGLKAGLYEKDPGFKLSNSWVKDLQGACDDLIDANGRMQSELHFADEDIEKQTTPTTALSTPSQQRKKEPTQSHPKARPARLSAPPSAQSVDARGAMRRDRVDERRWRPESSSPMPPLHHGYYPPPASGRTTGYFHPHPVPPQPGYYPSPPPPPMFRPPPSMYAPSPPPPGYYHPLQSNHYGASHGFMPDTHSEDDEQPSKTCSRMHSKTAFDSDTRRASEFQSDDELELPTAKKHLKKFETPRATPRPTRTQQENTFRFNEHANNERNLSRETSSVPELESLTSLENEYVELYQHRAEIQSRMNIIRDKLSEEQYRALIVRIEDPQLATLKFPGEK